MNGNATDRAFSAGGAEGAPPTGLLIGDAIPEPHNFAPRIVFHRSWSAPFLALAALCIRLDSTGPAIYGAPRIGKKGKKFNCYKLRIMVMNADAMKKELRGANERHGPFFKMENDSRITRCGRRLRNYSIDELPQLRNVVAGDMSLVGPRPHPLDDYERYTIEHLRRLDVKPGITGLWQVTARRGPSFETSMALDLEYIENWSLKFDLKIFSMKTVQQVGHANGR
jgi:lipopolysaccharide/colanic/teichoic acid biosynthesis glycosyltransferase